MNVESSLIIIKALSDKSRLFILSALLEKPHYVEEIAEKLKLAPSTVSFHLKKLESANLVTKEKEQYYLMYHINKTIFDTKLKDIISFVNVEETAHKNRIETYKTKVINTFFENGRLKQFPRQHKKKWIVLEKFIQLFEIDTVYSEKEVDDKIYSLFDDYCTIRRYLVDEGVLKREKGNYSLIKSQKESGILKEAFESSIKK